MPLKGPETPDIALQSALATSLAEPDRFPALVPRILRLVCRSLGWTAGALWEVDVKRRFLRCSALWQAPGRPATGFKSQVARPRRGRGEGLPGRVWAKGRPKRIPGAFALPIRVGGRVTGVLEFFSDGIEEPGRPLLMRLAAIGSQLGQFLERRGCQEQLRYQQAVMKAERRLAPDGVLVVDPDNKLVSCNRAFASMWDIPKVVLESAADVLALRPLLDKLVDPDLFLARLHRVYRHRRESSREEITLKDGRVFERRSAPIFGEFNRYYGRVWHFRDITRRRMTETALAASEGKYHKLFAHSSHAVVTFDPKTGLILDANKAAQKLYGYPFEKFRRLTYLDLSAEPEECRAAIHEMVAKSKLAVPLCWHKTKAGARFPVSVTGGTFRLGSRTLIIGAITDLSDRLKAQEVDILREKDRIAREHISTVSHELRTPTAAIFGFAETLLRGAIDEPKNRMRFVNIIYENAKLLRRLIDDLLDAALFESGKRQPRPQAVALAPLVRGVLRCFSANGSAANVHLKAAIPADMKVWGDATHIQRVFTNLLDNALKYTCSGGRVSVRAEVRSGEALVSVSDSGIGIPKADLPHIFRRFHRAGNAASNKIRGSGLGLSLVKNMVEANGGSIRVESREGVGSTFRVSLPLLSR